MTEPVGSKTFSDLVLKVAEFAGLSYYGVNGDEEAMIPVDRHDLFRCKRLVNDAIRMFIADAPKEGWRWQRRIMYPKLQTVIRGTASSGSSTTLVDSTYAGVYSEGAYIGCIIEVIAGTGRGEHALVTGFTAVSCTFTFSALSGGSTPGSDSEYVVGHRYILDQDFGGEADGKIRYIRNSNRGRRIDWTIASELAQLRENVAFTGYPYLAAVKPYGDRRWEIGFYPDPQTTDTLEFPYTKYFSDLDILAGIATAAAAAYITDDNLANLYADDYFVGWTITVISGTGKGGSATIDDYTGASGKIEWDTALSNGITPDTTSIYTLELTTQLHPAGYIFDHYIEVACLAKTEREMEDVYGGWVDEYQNIALLKAYEKDARSAPRKLGKMTNGLSSRVIQRLWEDRTYTGI